MQKKWFRLDTAALIFPAIMNRKWANAFRVSAECIDPIDPKILQRAVADLKTRFPNFYVCLSAGFFWYRLEESDHVPTVSEDFAWPLVHMNQRELKDNCVRVLYYRNRIAVECFHSVTDGTGGMLYLKNLVRRYAELCYGVQCPDSRNFPDIRKMPTPEEMEDSFFKYSSGVANTDKEEKVYHLKGTKLKKQSRILVTGTVSSDQLKSIAHQYDCSVTSFLAGVMAQALIRKQAEEVPKKKQKNVKIAIPVNLRRLYGSTTFRNFVLSLNIGVDPKQGQYSLEDLCSSINHQLKAKATPQYMAGMIAQNTLPQQVLAIRLVPLPIKNLIMSLVYEMRGENGGCINISNLGVEALPMQVSPYFERLDFIIGVQKSYPNNCSVVSYKGKTRINMIRGIQESKLEQYFFSSLVELGILVDIESSEV